MATVKLQNLYFDPDIEAHAEILEYYNNGAGGNKSTRIRDLVLAGWVLRSLYPTLPVVLSSMATEGQPVGEDDLANLLRMLKPRALAAAPQDLELPEKLGGDETPAPSQKKANRASKFKIGE